MFDYPSSESPAMSFAKKLLAVAAPAALLALSGCATGLPTQVSRFQQLPVPAGQTFVIQAKDAENRGGIEFARYADLVRQALAAEGYTPVAGGNNADLVVSLDYGVDNGQTQVVSTGFGSSRFGGFGSYGRFGGFGYRPYYSRFGYFGGSRLGFNYGWDDPFWYGGYGGFDDVRSYTVYTSYLDLDIRRPDGQSVFEGTVKARSRTDELTTLVPNLVEAMFTGFPGRSGETVKITVPPAPRGRR